MNTKKIENLGMKALSLYFENLFGKDSFEFEDIRSSSNIGCDIILKYNNENYYIELKASGTKTIPTNIRFAHQTIATLHNKNLLQNLTVAYVYNLYEEKPEFLFFKFGDLSINDILIEPHFIIQPKKKSQNIESPFKLSFSEVLQKPSNTQFEIDKLFSTKVGKHMKLENL